MSITFRATPPVMGVAFALAAAAAVGLTVALVQVPGTAGPDGLRAAASDDIRALMNGDPQALVRATAHDECPVTLGQAVSAIYGMQLAGYTALDYTTALQTMDVTVTGDTGEVRVTGLYGPHTTPYAYRDGRWVAVAPLGCDPQGGATV